MGLTKWSHSLGVGTTATVVIITSKLSSCQIHEFKVFTIPFGFATLSKIPSDLLRCEFSKLLNITFLFFIFNSGHAVARHKLNMFEFMCHSSILIAHNLPYLENYLFKTFVHFQEINLNLVLTREVASQAL